MELVGCKVRTFSGRPCNRSSRQVLFSFVFVQMLNNQVFKLFIYVFVQLSRNKFTRLTPMLEEKNYLLRFTIDH
jgi:hypothetical protein